jgi:non-ribosomal peptide synthetase component F
MRGQPELEPLIGFFANTLVYRTEVRPELSFRDLLGRVRETALGTLAHQDLPFEKVVEALNPPRDTSRTPLVQVNLRVEGREPELQLAGTRTEPLVVDPGISRFDLAIELGEADAGLSGYLEYDTALFHRDSGVRFVEDFLAVLEAVVDRPDAPVGELAALRGHRPQAKVD